MARHSSSKIISKQEMLVDLEGLEVKSKDAYGIDRRLGGVRRGESGEED
jgi:hypothetical protein